MTPGDCRCSILTYVDTCGIELHKVLACLNQTAMTNKTSSEALWACVSRRRLKEQQRPAEKRQWHRTSRIAHPCVVYDYSSNAQQATSVRKCHRFSLFNDLRNGLSFKSKWCRPNPRPQRPAGLELRKVEIVLGPKSECWNQPYIHGWYIDHIVWGKNLFPLLFHIHCLTYL